MKSNFTFLNDYSQDLAKIAMEAERYLHYDPNTSLFKSRLLVEGLISKVRPRLVGRTLMIRGLELERRSNTFPIEEFKIVVNNGNNAAHKNSRSKSKARESLNNLIPIVCWFYRELSGKMLIFIKVRSY